MGKSSVPLMAFDEQFKLVAIFRSFSDAAKAFGVSRQSIMNCVNGRKIQCSGYYWRKIDSNDIIESDDLGRLDMIEYDRQYGINHRIYKIKNRKRTIIFENELRHD